MFTEFDTCDAGQIPSIAPTLGRVELLSKLLSNADTPKSFRSRSSRADSEKDHKLRFKVTARHLEL